MGGTKLPQRLLLVSLNENVCEAGSSSWVCCPRHRHRRPRPSSCFRFRHFGLGRIAKSTHVRLPFSTTTKRKERCAALILKSCSFFAGTRPERGVGGGKDLNAFALDIFLKWLCGQQRDSIWIRFGYLAALAEKGL